MRIALIQKKVRWAGQPHHVLALAIGLRELGHQIFLVSQPGSEFAARATEAGFAIFDLPMTSSRSMMSLPLQAAAVIKLTRFVRQHQIEILHCHDSRDHQIGCVVAALTGVRLIRTKHNTLPLLNAGSRWVYGPRSSHLIAVAEAVRQGLIRDGIDPDHVTTVHNFVDSETYRARSPDPELRRALSFPEGAPIIGTLGRLHRAKGIGDLVRAMPAIISEAPEARFLLVGGSYLWWPPMVKELGLEDRCVFTGSVPNVTDFLSLMDVVVFPTLREALSLSILEAMCAARAVVATNVGGNPELIRHDVDGLLIEPERPDQIAAAVSRLLQDADLRHTLAMKGQETATKLFTKERCLEATESVYRKTLGG
jgi:glycosyltransferase involved in cell wall biosynthesis